MPKSSFEKPSKPTDEFFSDIGLEIMMERTCALITGITDFQPGGPDPYEKAKSFIREVVEAYQ